MELQMVVMREKPETAVACLSLCPSLGLLCLGLFSNPDLHAALNFSSDEPPRPKQETQPEPSIARNTLGERHTHTRYRQRTVEE